MSIEFRTTNPPFSEILPNDVEIEDAIIRTQDLPEHVPTKLFGLDNPNDGRGYLMHVDILVRGESISLFPASQNVNPNRRGINISYERFPQGMKVNLKRIDDGTRHDGTIHPNAAKTIPMPPQVDWSV